jgi:hypothetical protein
VLILKTTLRVFLSSTAYLCVAFSGVIINAVIFTSPDLLIQQLPLAIRIYTKTTKPVISVVVV